MWTLYQTAKASSSRPSELVGIVDPWAAYQLDAAVTLVGAALENASQEMHNVGTQQAPRYEHKYTVAQLLADDFRLPRPPEQPENGIEALKALAGRVKGINYRKVKNG